MPDDFKNLKDSLLKTVISGVSNFTVNENQSDQNSSIRELVSSLASLAGKGKDEIIQIISREIGIAVAGVIKEPLTQLLEDQKLKVTLEFVPKTEEPEPSTGNTPTKKSTVKKSKKKK